jgi:hypothetical protein
MIEGPTVPLKVLINVEICLVRLADSIVCVDKESSTV